MSLRSSTTLDLYKIDLHVEWMHFNGVNDQIFLNSFFNVDYLSLKGLSAILPGFEQILLSVPPMIPCMLDSWADEGSLGTSWISSPPIFTTGQVLSGTAEQDPSELVAAVPPKQTEKQVGLWQ